MQKFILSLIKDLVLLSVITQNSQALLLRISTGIQRSAILHFSHIFQRDPRASRGLQHRQQAAVPVNHAHPPHGTIAYITSACAITSASRKLHIILGQKFSLPQGRKQIQHLLHLSFPVCQGSVIVYDLSLGIPLLQEQRYPSLPQVHSVDPCPVISKGFQQGLHLFVCSHRRLQLPFFQNRFRTMHICRRPIQSMPKLFSLLRDQILQHIVAGTIHCAERIIEIRICSIRQRDLQAVRHIPGCHFSLGFGRFHGSGFWLSLSTAAKDRQQ